MRILVSDGSYKHTLAIVRDLGQRGLDMFVCSAARPAMAGLSRYSRRTFAVPMTTDSAYIEKIASIIQENQIELYIPVGYKSTLAAAGIGERLPQQCALFVADEPKVRAAADKEQMTRLAGQLGVPCPETVAPRTLDEALGFGAQAGFPLIIKGRNEDAPYATCYAKNPAQFETRYRKLVERYGLDDSSLPMIQQRLTGDGYGFFAFYLEGVRQAYFMHRRIREYPASGGPSTCAESFFNERLLDLGTRVLDHLKWHGVAMVEFKQDQPGGDYCFLEVNPKFWGSLDLALHCGVSFPYLMVQAARGEQIPRQFAYPAGVRFHWPLSGDFRGVARKPARFFATLCDCLNPKVASNVRVSDFKPNLVECLQTHVPTFVKRVVSGRRK